MTARYNTAIDDAKKFGLIRKTFRFEEWAEPRFLQAALQELGLNDYWKPEGAPQS